MLTFKRGPRKVLSDYKYNDIYKYYKKNNPNTYLDKKTVRKLYKEMFTRIVKLIVLDNFQFRMPCNLGDLRIKKKEVQPKLTEDGELDTRHLSINWKLTKQLWESKYKNKTAEEIKDIPDKPVVRELNEHTDGYRYVWYWERLTSNVPNQSAYNIDMTRTNDQILSGASKTNNLNFFT